MHKNATTTISTTTNMQHITTSNTTLTTPYFLELSTHITPEKQQNQSTSSSSNLIKDAVKQMLICIFIITSITLSNHTGRTNTQPKLKSPKSNTNKNKSTTRRHSPPLTPSARVDKISPLKHQ